MNIKEETIKKVVADYDKGLSLQKLAEKYQISTTRAFKIVHAYGKPRSGKFPEDIIEKVRHLYIDEGLSFSDVGKELGLSLNQVRGIINRNDFIKGERKDHRATGSFSKPIEQYEVMDTIYYPERIVPKKTVIINNQKYSDVSALFGI